jgi:thiamine biosynthesis lipoprotein
MSKMRIFSIVLCFLFSVSANAEWFADSQEKMGTRVEVRFWLDETDRAAELLVQAMAEFDRIETGMSTYIPESEISQLNATAAREEFETSAELFNLIDRALQLSATTGGAFDITYDSVGQLYDFRAEVRPSQEEIDLGLAAIDYRHVRLNPETSGVRFAQPGVRINLGGIAKGYAVESVIRLLYRAGVRHALASAGGDTRLLGDRGDKPWIVGVRDPEEGDGVVTRLALEDEAVSTSGDYERFFEKDGVRYHHILNPSTGKSAGEVRSVTVIGPDATVTDGLSTSVFVMGPQAGLELIESLPGYEAIIIDQQRRVRFSTGLDPG